ncbi:MAG TPA: hypothetical protein DF480_06250 [Clostridiales bacterium]|jgi:putative tricarboxylic transport membrane protein|nr:hypothetical protein [Clostridiales bacterium]
MKQKGLRANLISGTAAIIFGIWVWFQADKFPEDPTITLNSDFFPKVLVLGLIAASLSMMLIAYMSEKGEQFDSISLRKPAMQRVVLILAATMIYALVMKPLSFILGGMLYLFAVTFVLGNRKWKQMLLVSVIAPIVVFYIFKNVLGITLPMGILKFILR